MKVFNVTYQVTVEHEATVQAKNAEAAKKKVQEVIGEPIIVTGAWEITRA